MTLRKTLESNFPFGTTERPVEHQTSSLVISEEGFKEFIKKRLDRLKSTKSTSEKPTDTEKEMEKSYQWVLDNVIKGDVSKLTFKTGQVTIGARNASFFQRSGEAVDDIAKSAVSDLAVYQNMVNRYKTQITNNIKQIVKIKKEAEAFETRNEYPDGMEEFTKLMFKWENYVSPVSPGFSEPNVDLLGYGKQPFRENGLFLLQDEGAKPLKTNDLTIEALTPEKAKQVADVVKKLMALSEMLEKIHGTSDAAGIDASDSPFRGYYKEIGNKHQELLMLYTMPNFEGLVTALFYQIEERINRLEDALIDYLKKSIS